MISVSYSRDAFRTLTRMPADHRNIVRGALTAPTGLERDRMDLTDGCYANALDRGLRLIYSRQDDALIVLAITGYDGAEIASRDMRPVRP